MNAFPLESINEGSSADYISIKTKKGHYAAEIDPKLIRQEVQDEIARNQSVIYESKMYLVFVAKGSEIPYTMEEIARRRQITFENAKEGTPGAAKDTDVFDAYYDQIVIMERDKNTKEITGEILGGIRVGRVDEIRKQQNIAPKAYCGEGLYTNEQIEYKPEFFQKAAGAVELGRSYVIKEATGAGKIIFKGIAGYLIKFPEIRTFFGVVSLSDKTYKNTAGSIFSFLKRDTRGKFDALLAAKSPPVFPVTPWQERLEDESREDYIENFEQLNRLVKEQDHVDLPALLGFYSRLNGHFPATGFDHDKSFQTYDSLVVVDLLDDAPERMILFFFGREEGGRYLESHR